MRLRFWHAYQEEAGDGTGGSTGAGDGGEAPGGDAGVLGTSGEGAALDGGSVGTQAAEKEKEAPADMKAAIDVALGYKKPGAADLPDTVKKPAAEEKHANGAPKKNENGEDLDDKGAVVKAAPPKPKSVAELELTEAEKKVLGVKTQARFGEVIGQLKTVTAAHDALAATNKQLSDARDAMVGVLRDTHTSQDELGNYLEFNLLMKTGTPDSLNRALAMVEQQRAGILKALGKEAPGVDLLAEFPDLSADVEEAKITRERALEIASGRRQQAAATQRNNQQRQQQQGTQQQQQAAESALSEITAWTAELVSKDIDYKAKEDKLLIEIDGVIKEYPPNLWLPTLKRLYAGLTIQKAPPSTSGPKPFRPSGAKPGAPAPNSMLDAINQGLGYGKAQ